MRMKTYTAYFDASCKPEISRCAFYIEHNNKTVYKEVKEIHLENNWNNSQLAESKALLYLLEYIWNNIEPKSYVVIYGDAQNIIDVINNGVSPKYKTVIDIFQNLQKQYKLKIAFIPRKQNYKADRLTRNIPISIRREKTFLESRIINLNDVVVPHFISASTPNKNKYQDKLVYFKDTGCFKKPIKIDENFTILDGFIAYRILNDLGVETYNADIYSVNEYAV